MRFYFCILLFFIMMLGLNSCSQENVAGGSTEIPNSITLEAQVRDSLGNPISNLKVDFYRIGIDTLSPYRSIQGKDGKVTLSWDSTLPTSALIQTETASDFIPKLSRKALMEPLILQTKAIWNGVVRKEVKRVRIWGSPWVVNVDTVAPKGVRYRYFSFKDVPRGEYFFEVDMGQGWQQSGLGTVLFDTGKNQFNLKIYPCLDAPKSELVDESKMLAEPKIGSLSTVNSLCDQWMANIFTRGKIGPLYYKTTLKDTLMTLKSENNYIQQISVDGACSPSEIRFYVPQELPACVLIN